MCLSEAPSPQPVPVLPAPAQEQDAAVKAANLRNSRRAAAITGYQGTVLRGPMGEVGSTAPTTKLLGE